MRGWRSAVRGVVTTTCSRSWRISAASSTGGAAPTPSDSCSAVTGSENENVLPLPELALHPDPAAVVLDDLAADRQAEAGALRLVGERVADLLEALEHLRLIRRRDAHAGVDDADDDLAAARGRRGR